MFWQREVLRSGVGMTFNQTYELDLPKTGILGSLVLYIRSQENGEIFGTARKWRLLDYISKVEVMADGSTIIKSYDGRQALASAYHDDLVLATSMWRTFSNVNHRQVIPLHFGRKLMDEEYALDLARFNQVTLKVTNDATSTQFVTDVDIDVVAYFLREGNTLPKGYFREEEWRVWAPAAAAIEYNDLPTLLPIRRILLRARPGVNTGPVRNVSTMLALMSDIDFTIRTGQTRVYKGSLEQLGRLSILELGRYAESLTHLMRNDEEGYDVGVGYNEHGVVAEVSSTTTPSATSSVGGSDIQDSIQEFKAKTVDQPLSGFWRGYGMMHNVPLFDARRPDLSDILDPDRDKVTKVDITCASGTTVAGTGVNAESAIILSRLVR